MMYRIFFKRLVDVVLASTALVVLLPVIACVWVMVKLRIGSPVFFKQKRAGKDGKIFTIYKFRTMTNSRDKKGNLLPDEKRLTRFGKLLRSTSLDELPELLNILQGDMSIVGPRPLLVRYLPLYNEEQAHRHDVKPGLTGLAQIKGRNTISWEKRFQYDVYYVRHYSFLMDMHIIGATFFQVLSRKGIHAEGEATMPFFTGG